MTLEQGVIDQRRIRIKNRALEARFFYLRRVSMLFHSVSASQTRIQWSEIDGRYARLPQFRG